MFNFLKNIFSRNAASAAGVESGHATPGAVLLRNDEEIAAADAAVGESIARYKANGSGSSHPEGVPLMLRTVVAGLPQNLQVAIATPPDAQMRTHIPLPLIANQLSRGSVHVTFAELRKGSPRGVFSSSPIFDKKRVKLPLEDILVYVKPTRRPNQKRVEMPDDIPSLFTRDGRAILSENVRDVKEVEDDGSRFAPPFSAPESAPESPPESAPEFDETPVERPPLRMPGFEPPQNASTEAPTPEPEPEPETAPIPNSNGTIKFPYAMSDATPSSPGTSPLQPQDEGAAFIELALEAVIDDLPPEAKSEAAQASADAVIEIPLAELAPKMTRGRIDFTWAQLHGWMRPGLQATAHGATEVVLPLKEIIPLFMAAHRPAKRTSRKLTADEEIPNVFQGRGGNRFSVVKDSPKEEAEAISEESAAPVASEGSWHPKEFLLESASLDGVEGVLFASHDGLIVAEQMPVHVDAKALAAFLPEILGRTTDYLTKARVGAPDWMVLQVSGRMLQINRVGDLHLAILGETGRPLPRTKLREIMHRLAEAQPAH